MLDSLEDMLVDSHHGERTRTFQESIAGCEPADEVDSAVPGAVLISSRGRPVCSPLALDGEALRIGRDMLGSGVPPDSSMSRRHAEIRVRGDQFLVRDLDSRNGTFVDGSPVVGCATSRYRGVVRAGASLFLLCRDIRPFRRAGMERMGSLIMGPGLGTAWRIIARMARSSNNLLLRGESGVGKERAVQAFHGLGPRSAGPLVAVNCGAIPEGMAERLLFGTRRGAYSGANADAEGYVQAAHGGILFLDEVAELDLLVQAKLLRALEAKEVLPLGQNQPSKVDFQLCAATHRDLREMVASGQFRQDLYYRIARPEVYVPPLRERIEEIPWLVDMVVAEADLTLRVHPLFVEACLRRPWPGNIRELITETHAAVHCALAQGSVWLREKHLAATAGVQFEAAARSARRRVCATPDRAAIEAALRAERGNVAATARALGVHRTQLRRWLTRHGISGSAFSAAPGPVSD